MGNQATKPLDPIIQPVKQTIVDPVTNLVAPKSNTTNTTTTQSSPGGITSILPIVNNNPVASTLSDPNALLGKIDGLQSGITTGFTNTLNSGLSGVQNSVNSTITNQTNAISGLITTQTSALQGTLLDGFNTGLGAVKNEVGSLRNEIKSDIYGLSSGITQSTTSILSGLNSTTNNIISSQKDIANGINSNITSGLSAVNNNVNSRFDQANALATLGIMQSAQTSQILGSQFAAGLNGVNQQIFGLANSVNDTINSNMTQLAIIGAVGLGAVILLQNQNK